MAVGWVFAYLAVAMQGSSANLQVRDCCIEFTIFIALIDFKVGLFTALHFMLF